MVKTKALILLSVVALAAILGGWYVMAYATNSTNNINSPMMARMMNPELEMRSRGQMFGRCGRNEFIEISAEYNQTVVNILESDSDVQNLLTGGYSISLVRPIIKSVVQADGTVVTKSSSAVVILTKDSTGRAQVWVDITAGKVSKIEIMTRTIIEKP